MRKTLLISGIIFVASLCLLPMPAFGQENATRQFAAIQKSLLDAASTTMENASTAQPVEMRARVNSQRLQETQATIPDIHETNAREKRLQGLNRFVQPILVQEGVPVELAAVIQVESAGNPLALSPKGARGLWQLMPGTARRYGLIVDDRLDERLNLEKATSGAARYLRDLYAEFGSWILALAAYNTGEQNLQRAINLAHSRDFAILSDLGFIPLETKNYVPAVLAAIGSEPSPTIASQYTPAAHRVFATTDEDSGRSLQ